MRGGSKERTQPKWVRYTIMHGNRRVAGVRSDGTCTVYAPAFMPYNLFLEESDGNDLEIRLNNLENFYHWCACRVLTLDRKYAKEILNSLAQRQAVTDRERAQIAIAYHGLTFTDIYWIKGDREKVSFEEINLYNHSLSDAFVDVSLRGKQMTAQNALLLNPLDAAGNVSTLGVAPKAWIRQEDGFCLLKDGDPRDVRAELLASRIARCFDVEQVQYEEACYDGALVTKSRLVTSIERSIVSMECVEIYAANHDTTFQKLVMERDAYGFHMMNIVDYLIGNTDRHWGNWGFWVENSSNTLLTLHPLMDFNKAFLAYDTMEGAMCQTTEKAMSQQAAALEAVRCVGLNQIADVNCAWFAGTPYREMFEARRKLLAEAQNGQKAEN